ncbi:non-hydrolyzing UDP-N-acetylglucosamine 2-epimerase [Desulfobacter latus]|uniref:UDP-N-acetylglucosamine 2-epimerase (Non-hydrolyzing) n=1 Tax=Desulfobacter latus TaxID=2292 RepID=A0A850T2V3_9BACT|nr:UDP-N-acetylglucosamine 2-epimerase (non-hydrolyzing) [Desulfobacter latus]NWH06063.1 UDP-N-acetylglucosamine 2-epimerase (non-hydrolyzing) [Desulfobacter latus]
MIKIMLIAGARPNFMKIAPIARAFDSRADDIAYKIVHTGQHYDTNMSDVFFEELGIRKPDYHLGAGGGSHSQQTAKIMVEFEAVCEQDRPDLVMVVGDVNSTLACSVVAKKMHINVAHVEAGLRSFDLNMPEEINRMVTDAVSDLFFVTEEQGMANLKKEGKPEACIHFVGHVMIDNLFYQLSQLEKMNSADLKYNDYKSGHSEYGVVTLHRPSNVDDKTTLIRIFNTLDQISKRLPLIFPIHPRTQKNMEAFGITPPDTITLTPPLSYMAFLNLWKDAKLALTDSGGLQEETTALGIPCLTIRENTERPITITQGTNELVGASEKKIFDAFEKIMAGNWRTGQKPDLWDGRAAERITDILLAHS